ncbi:MAG: hypothetical protein KY434_00535 [Actinobacteria bacterium]|nr:hypothetical protein [Actinomycetota bacterium]
MTGSPWSALDGLAARQHGAFRLDQAVALGLSADTVRQRALREAWRRPHMGVFVLPGVSPDPRLAASAALLATGSRALIAGRTAAWLWGLWRSPGNQVELIVPADRAAPRLRSVRTVRTVSFRQGDADVREGLAVTTVARTVCELARTCGFHALLDATSTAVQRRLVALGEVERCRRRMGRYRGAARLRRVLDELGCERTDSGLERDVRLLLRSAGLRPAPGIYELRADGVVVARLDIAFPAERVAVEVDGFAWHATPADLRRDHVRENAIKALGWLPLRVGHVELTRHPGRFVAQLRAALALRGSTERSRRYIDASLQSTSVRGGAGDGW